VLVVVKSELKEALIFARVIGEEIFYNFYSIGSIMENFIISELIKLLLVVAINLQKENAIIFKVKPL
jgi:hypothetical protein